MQPRKSRFRRFWADTKALKSRRKTKRLVRLTRDGVFRHCRRTRASTMNHSAKVVGGAWCLWAFTIATRATSKITIILSSSENKEPESDNDIASVLLYRCPNLGCAWQGCLLFVVCGPLWRVCAHMKRAPLFLFCVPSYFWICANKTAVRWSVRSYSVFPLPTWKCVSNSTEKWAPTFLSVGFQNWTSKR